MSNRLDIAIVGSGPAGLSAALNAKIRNKSFQIFGRSDLSPKITKAHQINNYLGIPAISGMDLQTQFKNHLENMDIHVTEEHIKNIYPMGDYFSLVGSHENYNATSIIITTGMGNSASLPGETEFLGKGVGYCATCDAFFYRNKVVVLIAYSKHEEHEANYMAEVCKKVYYVPIYEEKVEVHESIEIIYDKPVKIIGEDKVTKLQLKEQEIETDGVFILRECIPPSQLLNGIAMDGNHISVDRRMQTSISGVFAAGDIVGLPYQYIKSAGEGNIAGLSAVTYVDQQKGRNS